MVEARHHEQDIALPLLSDHGESRRTARQETSDDWTHPSSHGKYSKWVDFPFRRIVQALLAITASVALGFAIYGSFVGFHAYRRLVFPHRAVHASPATARDGSRVVRPFFAPKAKGGVHSGTLLVRIWFRDGERPKLVPARNESEEYNWEIFWRQQQQLISMNNIGETGYVDDTLVGLEGQSDWIEQFATEIPITDIERTEDKVAHVTLPGHVIHSLVTKSRSQLVATFELLPDPTTIPSSLSYEHRSTRPVSLYGPSQPWPLPYTPPDPVSPSSLNEFFTHSGVGRSLKTRERDPRDFLKGDPARRPWEPEEKYATFLSARTWVTLSREYSIYGVDQYIKAQDALRQFKSTCGNHTSQEYYGYERLECYRTFDQDGHFENLLISDGLDAAKQWSYGPYLTTRLSPITADDYIELPSEADVRDKNPSDIEDFTFDWSVKYFAMSPAKLSLAQSTYEMPGVFMKLYDESYFANSQDKAEFRGALLGLDANPGSRPVARGIARFVSDSLAFLAFPLVLHYWYTRRVSTGISIIPLTIRWIMDLTNYIVACAVDMERVWILTFVLTIISFVAIMLKQLYLLSRPDFKWEHSKSSSLIYPSAVRFRQATVSEARSHKLDLKFDWRLRIMMTIVTFCLLRFAPAPPAIVAARKYPDIMQGFGGFQHHNSTVLSAVHTLAAIRSSIWLTACLSQISLNQRNKSFAGLYALTAYLQFGSLVFSQVTKIFVRWFGRSQLMQPFLVWDVVRLVVSGVMAIQARMLPKVEQVVEETLD